jgi:hypothetical protein
MTREERRAFLAIVARYKEWWNATGYHARRTPL